MRAAHWGRRAGQHSISARTVSCRWVVLRQRVDSVLVLLRDSQVLDAPALADDFYLNLVDWSAQNLLAVGLDTCVYLWSAHTSKVCTLAYILLV